MATMGWLRWMLPVDPRKAASPAEAAARVPSSDAVGAECSTWVVATTAATNAAAVMAVATTRRRERRMELRWWATGPDATHVDASLESGRANDGPRAHGPRALQPVPGGGR